MISCFFRSLCLIALASNPFGWVFFFFLTRNKKEKRNR